LFATVSSLEFQWKLLSEVLTSMRPINGTRAWWTSHFISAFSTSVMTMNCVAPSSFFPFDGKESGMTLPTPINGSLFDGGLTFVAHLELGATPAYVQEDSCLLFLRSAGGQTFAITFDPKLRISVHYSPVGGKLDVIATNASLFQPLVWLYLAVVIDQQSCTIYTNGSELASVVLKQPVQFTKSIDAGFIARSDTGRHLRGGISSVRLFGSALPAGTIELLCHLPNDFVYSFAPSSHA
jgi:hypothetical protein